MQCTILSDAERAAGTTQAAFERQRVPRKALVGSGVPTQQEQHDTTLGGAGGRGNLGGVSRHRRYVRTYPPSTGK